MKNITQNNAVQIFLDTMPEDFSYVLSNNVLLRAEDRATDFTRVYEEYYPALLRFCSFKVSSREKAVDIVSDTFIRIWQYLEQGNVIENEKSFLYTAARHLIIDEYRKKKSISLEILLDSGFEASENGEEDIYNRIDNNFLILEASKLPSPYNSIILMRYVDDFSVGHISQVIGNSENNVSVKIHRGLLKLRKILVSRHGYAAV